MDFIDKKNTCKDDMLHCGSLQHNIVKTHIKPVLPATTGKKTLLDSESATSKTGCHGVQ